MINNLHLNIKDSIAGALNEHLNYVDGYKLRLITDYFNIKVNTNDKYDYGYYMDTILFWCVEDLNNSINLLTFISNGYK